MDEHLLTEGWTVHGLFCGRTPVVPGCLPRVADLTRPAELMAALKDLPVKRVCFTA